MRSEIILGQLLLYTHGLGGKIVASNYYQTISTVGLMFSFQGLCRTQKCNAIKFNYSTIVSSLSRVCPSDAFLCDTQSLWQCQEPAKIFQTLRYCSYNTLSCKELCYLGPLAERQGIRRTQQPLVSIPILAMVCTCKVSFSTNIATPDTRKKLTFYYIAENVPQKLTEADFVEYR